MARSDTRVSDLWGGHAAPDVLREEYRIAQRERVTRAAAGDARASCAAVMACARGNGVHVTPRSEEQRRAGADAQYQHDCDDRCSKHVMLATAIVRKKCASQRAAGGWRVVRSAAFLGRSE